MADETPPEISEESADNLMQPSPSAAGLRSTPEPPEVMLDVHAPHESIHTWKSFFIHIAAICVGLLLAVGLEQSVEALHRQYERGHLQESLQHESEQILRDTMRVEVAMNSEIHWLLKADVLLNGAASGNHIVAPFPPIPTDDFDVPDNPVFKSAKASNRLALLSREEAEAYGEMNGLIDRINTAYGHRGDAVRAVLEVQRGLGMGHSISASSLPGSFDAYLRGYNTLAGLTLGPDDLKEMLRSNANLEISLDEFLYWSRQARGAASVMMRGERNLHQIEAAERQFNGDH
jgi:hypothetical protein